MSVNVDGRMTCFLPAIKRVHNKATALYSHFCSAKWQSSSSSPRGSFKGLFLGVQHTVESAHGRPGGSCDVEGSKGVVSASVYPRGIGVELRCSKEEKERVKEKRSDGFQFFLSD